MLKVDLPIRLDIGLKRSFSFNDFYDLQDRNYDAEYKHTCDSDMQHDRYRDILPNKKTMFKLSNGNYINANWVLDKTYIATQAPVPVSFNNFWDMVAESNARVIIQLTDYMENRKIKAHYYLPDKHEKIITNNTVVEYVDSFFLNNDIKITLIKINGQIVAHYHYLGWKDNQVPDSDSFIKFFHYVIDYRNIINKIINEPTRINEWNINKSPFIIHCSAGIGRTGTFIAIHYILKKYFFYGCKESVFNVVNRMRKCRNNMVQTEDQYNFIKRIIKTLLNL